MTKFLCTGCDLFFEDRLGTRVSSPPSARKGERQEEIICADCTRERGITAKDRALARKRPEVYG